MDKIVAKATEEVLKEDEEFRDYVRQAARKALAVQVYYLDNGSPQERIAAARGFMPVFAKALTTTETDDEAAKIHEKTRQIIGSMLTPKEKSPDVSD
jgi:hypothetical protein